MHAQAAGHHGQADADGTSAVLESLLKLLLLLDVARHGLHHAADDGALAALDLGEVAPRHTLCDPPDAPLDVGEAAERIRLDGAEVRIGAFAFEATVPRRGDAAATTADVGWVAVDAAAGFTAAAAGGVQTSSGGEIRGGAEAFGCGSELRHRLIPLVVGAEGIGLGVGHCGQPCDILTGEEALDGGLGGAH